MSSQKVETRDGATQTSIDQLALQVELCHEQLQQYRAHLSEMTGQVRALEGVVLEYHRQTDWNNEHSGLATSVSTSLPKPGRPEMFISTPPGLEKTSKGVGFPASSREGSIHPIEVSAPPSSNQQEFPLDLQSDPQTDEIYTSDDNVSRSLADGTYSLVESVDAEVESKLLRQQTLAKAPDKFHAGTSVVHLCKAYFASSGSCQIHEYDPTTLKWNLLPDCPRCDFSLAIINGLLTAIGGWEGERTTNTLVSFFADSTGSLLPEKSTLWEEHFPPMPTRRAYSTSASYHHYLIVAGGQGGCENKPLTNVEVFNTVDLQWYSASSLPFPVRGSMAAFCKDTVYILGGWGDSGDSVFACSITKLLETLKLEKSPHFQDSFQDVVKVPKPFVRCSCAWSNATRAVPLTQSTCVALDGQLLAIGGRGERGEASDGVFKLDSERDAWIQVGKLARPCYRCLAVSVSTGVVVVVGGLLEGYATDSLTVFQ